MTIYDPVAWEVASRRCCCVDLDRYDCWVRRYDMDVFEASHEDVHADGGPCACSCHDAAEVDDDDEY